MAGAMRATTVGAYVEVQSGPPSIRATAVGAYVEYGRPPRIRATAVGAYVEARPIATIAASPSGTPTGAVVPGFCISIFDRDFSNSAPLRMEGLSFQLERYSHAAIGGPDIATIKAYGDYHAMWSLVGQLRSPIVIYNQNVTPVWWGYISAVDVTVGKVQIGADLDTMYNRVAVKYTPLNAAGGETTETEATTAWTEDATSVAAYGYRELLHLADVEMDSTAALYLRDTLLAKYKYPTPIVKFASEHREQCAVITCRGWWQTLSWQQYLNYEGREVYEDYGAGEQILGWGLTSTKLGFLAKNRSITDIDAQLDAPVKGDKIVVSGTSSNNGTFTIDSGSNREKWTYTADTLTFDAADDDITDSAAGLREVDANDLLEVSGTDSNDGIYIIKAGSLDGSTVDIRDEFLDEAAGDVVTLTRGHKLIVTEAVVDEGGDGTAASATIKLWGEKVAQKFTLAQNVTWDASGLQVRVKKVGTPSDNLKLAIWSDNAGAPNAELQSGTIAGSLISADSADWAAVTLGAAQEVAYGTDYWLVASRSGSNDWDDYYVLDVNDDASYAGGAMKVYDGSAWQDPVTTADLCFRVTGVLATATQISDAFASDGQFISSTTITNTSGISTCQYRDGSRTTKEEVEELLQIGTTNGRRLLCRIDEDRVAEIYEEGEVDTDDYFVDADGTVRQWTGEPLEHGKAPVAIWANLREAVGITVELDAVADPTCFFIERAEYDVEAHEWLLEPREESSVWDLGWVTRLNATR